jgi:tRNA dimethylallyltransferase
MKTLVVILGPTGIGKTDLSIDIALEFGTEVISSDSRQVYKELKIGTAVPTDDQLNRVKHHLIGHKSIYDYYNASMFEMEVLELLKKLFVNRDEVIMTGGSGCI